MFDYEQVVKRIAIIRLRSENCRIRQKTGWKGTSPAGLGRKPWFAVDVPSLFIPQEIPKELPIGSKASVKGVPRHVLYYRYNDIFIQICNIIFQKEKSESDEENQTTGEGKDMTTMNRILDLTIKLTASALFISKVEESFNCVRLFKGKPIRENCVIEIAGETYT